MKKTQEVDIPEVGKFVLGKPKAGPRNDAMVTSGGIETEGQKMHFLFTVMPHCIVSHPWGNKYPSLTEACRDLETDQYDLLIKAVSLLFEKKGDPSKKSGPSSDEGESTTPTPSSPTSTSTDGSQSSGQANTGKNTIANATTSS